MDCERQIASSGPALLISFSVGDKHRVLNAGFGELGWFRQSCGTFRGISELGPNRGINNLP